VEYVKSENRNGVLIATFTVSQIIDESTIRQAGAELLETAAMAQEKKMLLSFRDISFMTSGMLGQLAILNKKCKSKQVTLFMSNVGPKLQEVFKLMRLDKLFVIYDDEVDALCAFKSAAPEDQPLMERAGIAAEKGESESQYKLAQCYDEGRGVPHDLAVAMDWYQKAADQNHADAQYVMGMSYAYGIHVPQDFGEALNWYRKAAEQGHLDAQYAVGISYSHGLAVPQDFSAAADWYRRAAEKGDTDAQTHLAESYLQGSGVAADTTEAINWYRKAAEQGHPEAQVSLAWFYWNGEGVSEDHDEAIKWYRKAAEQGNKTAIETLEEIGRKSKSN